MELESKKRLGIFAGRSSVGLADEIAHLMGNERGEVRVVDFASGEIYCRFEESVRGADVFIIQTHAEPVNQSIMELLVMIDAAKRASARQIVAVCPYFAYARQDRKVIGREPITAKLIADLLHSAGAHRMASVDLHSGQIQGFFEFPVDHLTAMPTLGNYLRTEGPETPVIVAPDAARVKNAERFSQHLGTDIAFCHNRSDESGNAIGGIIGDVEGRHCILVDDIIDTAGTMCTATEILMNSGATDVWMMATHAVLSGDAVDRLASSKASRVVVTNTLPIPEEKQLDKLRVLSVAPVIATVLSSVFEERSLSNIFHGENHF